MKNLFLSMMFIMTSVVFYSQGIKVSTVQGNPDSSAILEAESTTQGFLPPRMTTAQRDAINNPAAGLRIYNTDTACENFYNGTINTWMELCGSCPGPGTATAGTNIPSGTQVEWHWNSVPGATGYKWNTSPVYASATDVSTSTTYTQTGLDYSTSYSLYVWAYNACGGSLVPLQLTSATTAQPCTLGAVGPGGGRIFYCGSVYPGYVGLEASFSDQSASAQWGCQGSIISGADGFSLGTGSQNTTDIVSGCGTAGIAAKICDDLSSGGFSDWFLPAQEELIYMYNNLRVQGLGGFSASVYWSSSELDNATTARGIDFTSFDGFISFANKSSNQRVRCVRAFNF